MAGGCGLGPVKLIAGGIRAKQQLVAINLIRAIENRLPTQELRAVLEDKNGALLVLSQKRVGP